MMIDNWKALAQTLVQSLEGEEALNLSLTAEDTLFARMTQAKIRQSSEIIQGFVELSFFKNNRNLKLTLPFTSCLDIDRERFQAGLQQCRIEIASVPEDPFLQLPQNYGHFYRTFEEKIDRYLLLDQCLEKAQGQDFVGLFTAGEMIRANYNSAGLDQWFNSSTFALDFSLYTQNQQAVKGMYGGLQWHDQSFSNLLHEKRAQLQYLNLPLTTIPKNKYRIYLAPAAVESLVQILSWQGVSQEAYQRGNCALKKLVDGEKSLSSKFSLRENFTSGETPPFNDTGEIAPDLLSLINQGQYQALLCSSRSSQEYRVPSNFATLSESLRSPEILPGDLAHESILKELDTGLYVSNLHYLNWSDVQEGRITGMTRFGCFWVENGKITGPVKDMRFDESLYHFWGSGLEALTDKVYTFPELSTYFQRNLGSLKVPGMIVNDFTFVG